MSKTTSIILNHKFSDETIVKLPSNRKKGKNVNDFIDKTIGKPGSNERAQFESELRMEVFQELIKAARKKRNLSQDELGHIIGVKKSQISKLENGYENASISTIAKVFQGLNVKVRIIVEMDGKKLELYK